MANIHRIKDDVIRSLKSQTRVISPVSAVTELIQNSVDAGARKIEATIDLYNWKITVCDDGSGISPENLNKFGNVHFTSKISDLQDLRNLKTYGYRGEAISSLENISDITVLSKVEYLDEIWLRKIPSSAHEFNSDRFKLSDVLSPESAFPAMHKSWTIVIIENLLANLPVRRKYFQKFPTYRAHMAIKHDIFQILVNHPFIEVVFNILDEFGRKKNLLTVNTSSKTQSLHENICTALLKVYDCISPRESLKYVAISFNEYQINGIISITPVRSKEYQFIFINGRKYRNPNLLRMMEGLLMNTIQSSMRNYQRDTKRLADNHPIFVFHVQCPISVSDLIQNSDKSVWNSSHAHIINPLLLKVVESFSNNRENRQIVNEISQPQKQKLTNMRKTGLHSIRKKSVSSKTKRFNQSVPITSKNSWNTKNSRYKSFSVLKPVFDLQKLAYKVSTFKVLENPNFLQNSYSDQHYQEISNTKISCLNMNIDRTQIKDAEVINQIDGKFILLRLQNINHDLNPTLIIVDQHASDERIKLESCLKLFLVEVVTRTIPIENLQNCEIPLVTTEIDLFQHFEPQFEKWGISYEVKANVPKKFCLYIKTVPKLIHQGAKIDVEYLKALLLRTINDIKNSRILNLSIPEARKIFILSPDRFEWWKYIGCIPSVFRDILNNKACRSSIMFGDKLSKDECKLLIRDLANCKFPFQCAHGRPSIIPIAELKPTNDKYDSDTYFASSRYPDYDIFS